MPTRKQTTLALLLAVSAAATGCGYINRVNALYQPPPPVRELGSIVDPIWENQEGNAEASQFYVYQHEFDLNTDRLNMAGMDHVRQIAARISEGRQVMPVVVERSMTTAREESSEYAYPVNPNPALDMKRREVIVRSLQMMNVPEAEELVVIAPAIAEGYQATEAQRAYARGISGGRGGRGGFGGGFGGGLGGGIGGGLGGIGGFF